MWRRPRAAPSAFDARTYDRMLSEAEIRRVIARYCRGIDRLDPALVRSCYHRDAVDDHGSFVGAADDFVAWALAQAGRYDVTMHFIGNIHIEFGNDPDTALAETYAIAFHRRAGGRSEENLTAGFRYIDRFDRRPVARDSEPEWRIAARQVIGEWLRHDDPEGWWPLPMTLTRSRRDKGDPSYRLLSEIQDGPDADEFH